jgi:enolase-phosphatase E1
VVRFILIDIEGTTTPITFVHEILFPYSAKNLTPYIMKNRADKMVQVCLEKTKKTISKEDPSQQVVTDHMAIKYLLDWITHDRKHPALKTLQGMIWQKGYETKAFTSPIYDDVLPSLEEWRQKNINLGIYSSGSVAAQKLLFKYTDRGNLLKFFDNFFDMEVGPKKLPDSYLHIAKEIDLPPSEILFLSDIQGELDAAREAGILPLQVVRPGTEPCALHEKVESFREVRLPQET